MLLVVKSTAGEAANMKLLFSEQNSDYEHYQFPYAIWAVPEEGESPSDIFDAGFLPSSRNLDRFYLCRQVRVNLAKFKPSSENRRILRKGKGIERGTRAARQIRLHAGAPPVFQDLRRHQVRQGRDDVRAAGCAVRRAHHLASARVHRRRDRQGNRRGDALPRRQGAGILLLRILRPELLRAQPRHVHDDLGGGTCSPGAA